MEKAHSHSNLVNHLMDNDTSKIPDEDDKELIMDKGIQYRRKKEQIDPNYKDDSPYHRDPSNYSIKGIV
jgi:hypothetical protein